VDLRRTVISSKRLSLAAFAPGDAPEIFDAVTPTLTRFMAFEPSPTLAAFADVWGTWPPQMAAGTELYLVLRLRTTGEFLGIAGLHGVGKSEPETGIWIKEQAHGFGYGREALQHEVAGRGAMRRASVHLPVVERPRHLAEPGRRLSSAAAVCEIRRHRPGGRLSIRPLGGSPVRVNGYDATEAASGEAGP
jgi:hypothetical protein